MPLDTAPQVTNGQIVSASTALNTYSPYVTVVNSPSATTITLPTSPTNWEMKAIVNVGTGITTASYTGINGATNKTIAQSNCLIFQYIPIANYWAIQSYSKPCTWSYFTPTSGSTINIPIVDAGSTSNVIIKNSGLLAVLTFVFPITGVQDGQIVKISAQNSITLVTMNVETGGSVWGALGGLLGGGSGVYQFDGTNKVWIKF
jgi:hypothetical protein